MQEFDKALWPELVHSLKFLYKAGIREFTITSPLLMELMREKFPDVFLEISTICEVNTVRNLRRWAEIDVDGVCAKLDLNRDISGLKRLSEECSMYGIALEVLANEFCLLGCAWRQECYNLSSHDSQRGPFEHYPFGRCQKIRLTDPSEWIKAGFILPQWMSYYLEHAGVGTFKITGRTHPPRVILPIIEKYMSRKHTGNLLELWPTIAALAASDEPQQGTYIDTEEVEKHVDFLTSGRCSTASCAHCGYCKSVFKDAQRRVL
jgi:collagenase-like PrtC family protease